MLAQGPGSALSRDKRQQIQRRTGDLADECQTSGIEPHGGLGSYAR